MNIISTLHSNETENWYWNGNWINYSIWHDAPFNYYDKKRLIIYLFVELKTFCCVRLRDYNVMNIYFLCFNRWVNR